MPPGISTFAFDLEASRGTGARVDEQASGSPARTGQASVPHLARVPAAIQEVDEHASWQKAVAVVLAVQSETSTKVSATAQDLGRERVRLLPRSTPKS